MCVSKRVFFEPCKTAVCRLPAGRHFCVTFELDSSNCSALSLFGFHVQAYSQETSPSAMAQQEEVLDTSTATEPSPMRKKRIEEKEELAHLNDRFLDYIQQVRRMKDVNFRLEAELQTVKDQLGKEAESVKLLYEAELADARTLIDETAKEKARQQILNGKSTARIDELEAE